MKKTITVLLLITASVFCFSQAKEKADTIPPNNEPIVSVDQINNVLTEMKKTMTIDQLSIYDLLLRQIQTEINLGVIEWRKKLKKTKK